MLASVNTFVVSWNDAADIKLSVLREALVMPRISGSAEGRPAALDDNRLIGRLELALVDLFFEDEFRIPHVDYLHPPHHLAHDHLDVLVVDAHALEPVHFLDFIHEISARATSPLIFRMSWGMAEPPISASPART